LPFTRALVSSLAITALARTSAAIRSAGSAIVLPTRASMLAMAPCEMVRPSRPWQTSVSRLKPIIWQPCR
jgi:hypothetical protein